MSAIQILKEIENLSRDEQEVVIAFVHQLERALAEKGNPQNETSSESSIKWAVEEHRELLSRLAK